MGIFSKIFFLFFAFLFAPSLVQAASLNFSPASGSYGVGTTFSLSVNVESVAQAMNAASGVVSFPWDKLEVVSISKQGSIFSLWPVEPSFSNSQGTVSFEGIVLNPGYTGPNGKILTVTFKARSAGVANVSFSSGSVLANDGTGTNILDGLRVATYTLKDGATSEPVLQSDVVVNANTLGIFSPTHPDQDKWYADDRPEFVWTLPDEAVEVRTLIGKSPSTVPSVSYNPPISKKKLDELPDGTYYFAVQVRTKSGWGEISRYRVNIDTTPPKPFSVTFPHGNKSWEPQPVVLFNTEDEKSGISHYEIKIGTEDKPVRSAPQALSNPYVLPARTPGNYKLLVTAIDGAGNIRTSSGEYTIEGIDPPVVTYYPESIEEGDLIKIRGTTYPDSDVMVYVYEGNDLVLEEYTRSNSLGDFGLVFAKRLNSGVYTFTVRVKDARGAQSLESSPLTISVDSELVSSIVSSILKYLSGAIMIILVLGGILWIGTYLWFRVPSTISRMRREAKEAEHTTERAFRVLRDGVAHHIVRLKKVSRKLTKEETAFLDEFEDKLEDAEEIITKEIRDISES